MFTQNKIRISFFFYNNLIWKYAKIAQIFAESWNQITTNASKVYCFWCKHIQHYILIRLSNKI